MQRHRTDLADATIPDNACDMSIVEVVAIREIRCIDR